MGTKQTTAETKERVTQITAALKELGDRRRPDPTLEEIQERLDGLLPNRATIHKGRVRVQMVSVYRDDGIWKAEIEEPTAIIRVAGARQVARALTVGVKVVWGDWRRAKERTKEACTD